MAAFLARLLAAALLLTACSEKAPAPRWPDTMLQPDKVVARRVSRGAGGPSEVQLPPDALAQLRALLDDETALSRKMTDPMKCPFNPDLELVWTRGTEQITVVFCFTCGETQGVIHSFSIQRVAALAAKLFPAYRPFARAAQGLRAHVPPSVERWPVAMQQPRKVVAWRLDGLASESRDAGALPVFQKWVVAEEVVLSDSQVWSLEQWLGNIDAVPMSQAAPSSCLEHADFALQWTRDSEVVDAVFCLAGGEGGDSAEPPEVDRQPDEQDAHDDEHTHSHRSLPTGAAVGTAGIRHFDPGPVGQFAFEVFPSHAAFKPPPEPRVADKITSLVPTVQGSLDEEVIRSVFDAYQGQLRYCYESELRRCPKLAGKVSVKLVIAESGRVTSSKVSGSTLGNASVDACVARRVEKWEFPKPKGGGVVVVTYPLVFEPARP